MTTTGATALALAIAATPVVAQETPSTTLERLLHEVRLLREAMERQGAFQAHVQLVAGRLTLQDQRVARLKARDDRLRTETAEAHRAHEGLVGRLNALERVSAYEAREAVESELEQVRMAVAHARQRLSELQAESANAAFELEAAQSRFAELESHYEQLDRALNRTTR